MPFHARKKAVISKTSQFNIHLALALLSLSLAVSCAAQNELPRASAPIAVSPEPARTVAAAKPMRSSPTNTVKASYMADAYAGRRTASGEKYDPKALTAASSTFPIGSTVMVTNPSTGRSVKVRINDRSLKAHARSLDLSKRAAEELGMTKEGVTRVGVKRVSPKPEGSSSTVPPKT